MTERAFAVTIHPMQRESAPVRQAAPAGVSDFPEGVSRGPDGVLCFSGVRLTELAERYGTPLLVLSEDVARAAALRFIDAFRRAFGPRASVSYAAKALALPAFFRALADLDLSFDVVSAGEAAAARFAGIAPERLRLHGNNKPDAELRMAAAGGVGQVVIDNPEELERWIAMPRPAEPPVLLRVAPGLSPDTHEYISTGGRGGKFGFDGPSGEALRGLLRAYAAGVRVAGLHAHLGSQIEDVSIYAASLSYLYDLRRHFHERTGVWLEELNIGGGPAYRYTEERALDAEAWAAEVARAEREAAAGQPPARIGIEPGRAIAAPAGLTVYTVGDAHRVPGFTPVVAVDGGMGDNIRPALYHARYGAARVEGEGPVEVCHIVGRYCESGDVLITNARLPRLRRGDRLAVFGTGAYTFPMSMRYNGVPRPAVVLVRGGEHACVCERETEEDLLRGQRLAPWQVP
ncbi:MAG: diaminopimelate decarboxylase [Firmicutes bacterium]|nr:diaminopimelate decarboxylase [Bacillota bacterium]